MKNKVFFLVILCIPFICLELFFRLLPVSYPPHLLDVDENSPVLRFQENIKYLWSNDWDFKIVSHKRTNNLGFVSDIDYIKSNSDPLLMIIGDSFVEAHQVANAESVAGVLGEKTKSLGRVYSIGFSGAALSQYLVFAEHAKNEFSPDSMVFIIISNDYDENLLKHKSVPRFHYFEEKDGKFVLTRVDYKIGTLKKILRKSAMIRYLMLNLHIKESLFESQPREPDEMLNIWTGKLPYDNSIPIYREYESGVDEFFHLLPEKSGLDRNKILFVMDGVRPQLYTEQGLKKMKVSGYHHMRSYFISAAERLGYEVKNMQSVFIERNRLDGSIFEFTTDGHWNQLGHKLVGSEIENSQVYKNTFDNP